MAPYGVGRRGGLPVAGSRRALLGDVRLPGLDWRRGLRLLRRWRRRSDGGGIVLLRRLLPQTGGP